MPGNGSHPVGTDAGESDEERGPDAKWRKGAIEKGSVNTPPFISLTIVAIKNNLSGSYGRIRTFVKGLADLRLAPRPRNSCGCKIEIYY
jgi:hypothetical protein